MIPSGNHGCSGGKEDVQTKRQQLHECRTKLCGAWNVEGDRPHLSTAKYGVVQFPKIECAVAVYRAKAARTLIN